jgi:amino-acid N-acetyltransferase
MSTTIRAATIADVPRIEALLRDAQLPTDGVADIVRNAPGDFLVAEQDGDVVGGGALEVAGGDALLRSVVVRSDVRSEGVGALVVDELLEAAERRQLGLYLLTTTADNWFPRFGFARVDRATVPEGIAATWEFKTGCAQTAVAMAKPVG